MESAPLLLARQVRRLAGMIRPPCSLNNLTSRAGGIRAGPHRSGCLSCTISAMAPGIQALRLVRDRFRTMERMPPGPPRSIRRWGWVLLAFSLLNMVTFAFGTLARFASSKGEVLPVVDAIVFLGMVATGIGFMNGWRWTWFLGLMLGVAAVTYGGWVLFDMQRDGADISLPGLPVDLILFLIAPGILLLLSLFSPATLRWMGFLQSETLATPLLPTATAPDPARRRPLVPAVTVLVAAAVVASWFWFGRVNRSFPDEAAGFRLRWSRTVVGGLPFGPPAAPSVDTLAKQRLALYVDGADSLEVRLTEYDLTRFTHNVLLKAALIGIETSPKFPKGHLGRTTSETIDGVAYTCVRTKVASGCLWTEEALTGWALGSGRTSIDRLRALARAIHDAVT
jgi:hypothetical protein